MRSFSRLVNTEYAGMQCTYCMLTAVSGLASVFLRAKGYSNAELGIIIASANVLALLLQPTVASMADRDRRFTLLVLLKLLSAFLAITAAVQLFAPPHSPLLTVDYALFLCSISLMQPFVTSFCMVLQGWGADMNYGVARGLGSLAYAIVVAILGVLVKRGGASVLPCAGLALLMLFVGILLIFSCQSGTYGCMVQSAGRRRSRGALEFLRGNGRFMLLLGAIALLFTASSLYSNFQLQVVSAVGGDSADVGGLCAFAAVLELPAMFFCGRLLRRFSSRSLLMFAAAMFAVKIAAIWLASNMTQLYLAQIFQAFSYAVLTPVSVRYVEETVDPADAVKGQAYITAVTTFGSVLSGTVGGFLYDGLGTAQTLGIGAALALAGALLMVPAVRKNKANLLSKGG